MGLKLQLIFVLASLLTFVFVIRKIRKHGLSIENSIIWILWVFVLLVVSVFPGLPTFLSNTLGFMSTSNFILCLFIFFLYIVVFLQAIQISTLNQKQKELIQKLSIKEYKEKHNEKSES